MSDDNGLVILGERELKFLDSVSDVVSAAMQAGDLTEIFTFGLGLRNYVRIGGLAMAKLLGSVHHEWDTFQAAGIEDTFEDSMQEGLGLSVSTIRKYVRMWQNVFENDDVPTNVKQALLYKPMKGLLLLTAAAKDEDFPWDQIVSAGTVEEIRDVVREFRGDATSSVSALTLQLDIRTGSLTAWQNGESEVIGTLNMQRAEENGLAAAAVQRLIDSARIREK